MKRFLPLVAFAACVCVANAQSTTWMLMNDTLPFSCQAVGQLPDRSVIAVGTVQGAPDSAYYYYGSSVFEITRISETGSVMWAKKFDGSGSQFAASTVLVGTNAVYASYNYVNYAVYDSLGGYASYRGLFKMDFNGNVLASNAFSANDYYMGSYNHDRLMQLPGGNLVRLESVFSNFKVSCLDQNLNLLWSRTVVPDSGSSKNPALGLTYDPDDSDIIVTGKCDNRMVVTAFSQSGQYIYGRRYDNATKYLRGYNAVPVSGGGLLMAGLYYDQDSSASMYLAQSFLCRMDAQGNVVWIKSLQDANNANAYNFSLTELSALPNGNCLFTGATTLGNRVLGEFDANGTVVWSKVSTLPSSYNYYYGYTYNTEQPLSVAGNDIATAAQISMYPYGSVATLMTTNDYALRHTDICGYTASQTVTADLPFDYTMFDIPAGGVSNGTDTYTSANVALLDITPQFHATELCSTVNTGIAAVGASTAFSISPNPATDVLTVNGAANGKLMIYNGIGQLIVTKTVETNSRQVDVSQLASGVYMAVFASEHGLQSQKFAVQH